MVFLYVLIASFFVSIMNLCLQRILQIQRTANGYYEIYFIVTLVSAFFFFSDFSSNQFSVALSLAGICTGVVIFIMLLLIARALQIGPFGLTFAFQNSACILPPIILYVVFGKQFGFDVTPFAWVGFACIVCGLFLSSRGKSNGAPTLLTLKWILLAVTIFLLQGSQLLIYQWRCLLFANHTQTSVLIPKHCQPEHDVCFMVGMFLVPAVLQAIVFGYRERRWFSLGEALLGIVAGMLNGGATFFLIIATKIAIGNEQIVLFPLYAVSVILLCSLYGWKWKGEKINWVGLLLCIGGVLLGLL